MKLIMTKGLPGSGKSTWAKNFCNENPTYVRVNKDSLRTMIASYTLKSENFIVKLRDSIIRTAFTEKKNIVVDDTNLDPKHEFNLRKIANEFNAEFEIKSFLDISMKQCIAQDLKREHSVGEKVIKKMYRHYLAPKRVDPPTYIPKAPSALICDIDGTLAIHVARGPYEMEKCDTDAMDYEILKLVCAFLGMGAEVIFVTGREETYRAKTEAWLRRWMIIDSKNVHMRPAGDHRDDSIIKQEIYDAKIKGKYNVQYVLDDRNRVVEMWRQNGLKCLQVAEGDF